MKLDGLLPIGSVVLLKDATRKLMIVGYGQKMAGKEDKVYDYAGCLYPEGFVGPDKMFLFDDSQIGTLCSYGYLDEKAIDYIPRVQEAIQEVREGR